MPNFNNCTFVGHIGRDAETKFTQGGTSVMKFSLAVQSGYGDRKKTSWVEVIKWKPMDWMEPACTKGAPVMVSGELEVREYEGRDGQKRLSVEVTARDLVPLRAKESGEVVSRPRSSASAQSPQYAEGVDDDSIPF